MSFDEGFLAELIEPVSRQAFKLIGNTGAILHGVPVLTQDVDLMVREPAQLEEG